jgi:hypothetical protein
MIEFIILTIFIYWVLSVVFKFGFNILEYILFFIIGLVIIGRILFKLYKEWNESKGIK